jgi:hypothetical protein
MFLLYLVLTGVQVIIVHVAATVEKMVILWKVTPYILMPTLHQWGPKTLWQMEVLPRIRFNHIISSHDVLASIKHKCLPENREQVINPKQACTVLKCECQSVDKHQWGPKTLWQMEVLPRIRFNHIISSHDVLASISVYCVLIMEI